MRNWLAGCLLIILVSAPLSAQTLESYLSLDLRGGYGTNSMMFPFHGEWDRELPSAYGLILPSGTVVLDRGGFSSDVSMGGIFETFLEPDRHTLRGVYGLWNMRYALGSGWTAGMESGGNRMRMEVDRASGWLIPWVSWQPNLFTRMRVKAGSSFRQYRKDLEGETVTSATRFDLYTLEMERWIGFRWQVKGGLFGDLSDPAGTASLFGSVDHLITNRLRAGVRTGVDQFSYQMSYVDGSIPGSVITLEEKDRIWRSGIQARYQLSEGVSLSATADHLTLSSATSDQLLHDFHVSAGVRFTIRPGSGRDVVAEADWRSVRDDVITLNIRYNGDGELYLIGDFNDWREPGVPLRRVSRNRYAAELALPPGGYEYKILLIGGEGERTWIDFSDETYTVPDGFGGENGMIFID